MEDVKVMTRRSVMYLIGDGKCDNAEGFVREFGQIVSGNDG